MGRTSTCHVTLIVRTLVGGNLRAGFLESPESKYILVDFRTGLDTAATRKTPEASLFAVHVRARKKLTQERV